MLSLKSPKCIEVNLAETIFIDASRQKEQGCRRDIVAAPATRDRDGTNVERMTFSILSFTPTLPHEAGHIHNVNVHCGCHCDVS
jgi:hypothetical protein